VTSTARLGLSSTRARRVTSGRRIRSLVCTLHGLPVGFVLTGAKADERHVLLDILADPDVTTDRVRQTIIGDKNFFGADFEAS
jgi:hypothetical protein